MENFINFWSNRGARRREEGFKNRVVIVILSMTVMATSEDRLPASVLWGVG